MGEFPLLDSDSYLSYLPASHVFEQIVFAISATFGMKVGFFGGNTQKLVEDC